MSVSTCCFYMNCDNSRFRNKDLSFFKFPTKNLDRCKVWVKNSGNPKLLDLGNNELSVKALCEKHFGISSFFNHETPRKRLCSSAIPTSFHKEDEDDMPPDLSLDPTLPTVSQAKSLKIYSRKSKRKSLIQVYSSDDVKNFNTVDSPVQDRLNSISDNDPLEISSEDIPRTSKLRTRSLMRKTKYHKFRNLDQAVVSQLNRPRKNISFVANTFMNMQFHNSSQKQWLPSQKKLALSLYHKSPTNYRFMLKTLKFKLPSLRTIRSWLKIFHLKTGVNTIFVKKLAAKCRTMTTLEKQCVLMFAKTQLKSSLDLYSRYGFIEGFCDYGKLGRTPVTATSATIFHLRGLQSTWQIPFCYYVGSMKAEMIKDIVITVLQKLFSLGLQPKILVCRQGPVNRKMFSLFNITSEMTFITIGDCKVFACFDTSSLIRSLRNNFCNELLGFLVDRESVRWMDVIETYRIDNNSATDRTLMKLTESHIQPNAIERKKVKFAAQIFSNSVSEAIHTVVTTGQLKSPTAHSTAMFIKIVNDIFDCLTSRSIFDLNPIKCGLSLTKDDSMKLLTAAVPWLQKITVFKTTNIKTFTKIHCLDGLALTVCSILDLWSDITNNEGAKVLLTGRINLDALDNTLNMMRRYGGYDYPTCKQFRLALQHNMHVRLQESVKAADYDFYDEDLIESTEDELSGASGNIEGSTSTIANPPITTTAKISDADFDQYATSYLASYLIYYFSENYYCSTCLQNIVEECGAIHNAHAVLNYWDYAGDTSHNILVLKKPSVVFLNFVTMASRRFNAFYNRHKCVDNFYDRLIEHMTKSVISENCCQGHIDIILKQLIKVKLFKTLTFENEKMVFDPLL